MDGEGVDRDGWMGGWRVVTDELRKFDEGCFLLLWCCCCVVLCGAVVGVRCVRWLGLVIVRLVCVFGECCVELCLCCDRVVVAVVL